MRIVGIVAEYNPFHNGHAYMIKKIRDTYKDSVIIAVMSGSFTQRGEVAILDKWTRARLAVLNGCDVVIELPFVYAASSGEFFAKGAVNILDKLNIADIIAFGSETANLDLLTKTAKIMDDKTLQRKIRDGVKSGASYATALSTALEQNGNDFFSLPNTILAVEYLRALKNLNSAIEPMLIERQNSHHNDKKFLGNIASASAIRAELFNETPNFSVLKNVLPFSTFNEIKDEKKLAQNENLFKPLLSKIYSDTANNLQNICGINEGLENRIIKMAKNAQNMEDFISRVSAKRYPKSRISRIFSHILVNFQKDMASRIENGDSLYARLLAFNGAGQKIFKDMKKKSQIPIIEKTTHFLRENTFYRDFTGLTPLQVSLALDIRATNLQTLALANPSKGGADFTTSPYFIT